MPIIDSIDHAGHTKIITWDVTESNEEMLMLLNLNPYRLYKFSQLRPKQAQEYLGLRACLQELGVDYDVNYNEKGKPYLPTTDEISITHSYGKVAVGVSEVSIGIDIELERPKKIANIKQKFVRKDEQDWLPETNEQDYLHIIWGIKEGLYKLNGGNLWNFLHHYRVEYFPLIENQPIVCWISDEYKSQKLTAYYKRIGDHYLIWVLDHP